MSSGLNVHFSIPRSPVSFYLGAGATAAYLHLHDHSHTLPQHTSRWSAGVVGKSGFLVNLNRYLLNSFFDYYYQPVKPRATLPESRINVGGFRVGLGLGYLF